jgi:signal transduction histidine kinase/CheY-like chemotaxis protein
MFKSFRNIAIKNKLRIIILLTSGTVLGVSSAAFFWHENNYFRHNMLEELNSLAALVGSHSQVGLRSKQAEQVANTLQSLRLTPQIMWAYVFNAKGNIFATYQRKDILQTGIEQKQTLRQHYFSKLGAHDVAQQIVGGHFFRADAVDVFQPIYWQGRQIGTVYLRSDLDELDKRLNSIAFISFIIFLGTLLLAFILASRLQHVVTRPVYALLKSMHSVSQQQDYSVRAKHYGNDELGELVDGFNQMLDELSQYHNQLETKVATRTKELAEAHDQALAANKAKSVFLANMSHEIRTPMNAVLGYTQILQRDSDSPQQREKLQLILNSGNHLLGLINDILDISKIEAGAMELNLDHFRLHNLLSSVSDMFRVRCEQKEIHWVLDTVLPKDCTLHADEGKLRQILINLLGNAVKFTESGGEVSLSVRTHGDSVYEIRVNDTGQGISEHAQKIIFEPFQQEKAGYDKGGTGLGLAITQRQVELMSGEISVHSQLGAGSCFMVKLRLATGNKQTLKNVLPTQQVQKIAAGKIIHVLVVDDVLENRDILSYMLREIGAQVREVSNGKLALEAIADSKPDIVFMDIRMPVMDGMTAIRRIREQYTAAELPCVAITASTLHHQNKRVLDAGFDYFIAKPFHFDEVYQCLTKLLQVHFLYTETVEAQIAAEDDIDDITVDFSTLTLSENLFSALHEAAEFSEVAELERLLQRLQKGSTAEHALAKKLDEYISQYDFDAALEVLDSLGN